MMLSDHAMVAAFLCELEGDMEIVQSDGSPIAVIFPETVNSVTGRPMEPASPARALANGAVMRPMEVFRQRGGAVTAAFYLELNACGPAGQVGVALFRAQKRSTAAKQYRRGSHRQEAYKVKSWSMGELCRLLSIHGEALGISYGWKTDPGVLFGNEPSWVLYIDLPKVGQVSFHNPDRGEGPAYAGEWDGRTGESTMRIIQFCEGLCT